MTTLSRSTDPSSTEPSSTDPRSADPSSIDPSGAQLWRAARSPAAVVLVVLLAALAMALAASGGRSGQLDPRAADASGTRALAQVLRQQGVTVRLVTSTRQLQALAAPGDLVLVALPDRPSNAQAAAVAATGADLLLVATRKPGRYVRGVRSAGRVPTSVLPPGCRLPAAVRAGRAATGGFGYEVGSGVGSGVDLAGTELCYAQDGAGSVVSIRQAGRAVTLLGSPVPLTNRYLDEDGNAALALGLTGTRPRLLWFLPGLDDLPAGARTSIYRLVPDGVWWALGQASMGIGLLALWRARRLGPVVVEPLPVVVRAAEAVEGRARLYRRAGARDAASAALRSGVRSRLTSMLGLPRRTTPGELVAAVAARTRRTALDISDLTALLYGTPPADDAALVRLADQLDILEETVRRS